MKNFFDFMAPFYEWLPVSAENTFKKIEEIGNFSVSDVVVDVGGGTGRIAQFLVGTVKSITVIDPSNQLNDIRCPTYIIIGIEIWTIKY